MKAGVMVVMVVRRSPPTKWADFRGYPCSNENNTTMITMTTTTTTRTLFQSFNQLHHSLRHSARLIGGHSKYYFSIIYALDFSKLFINEMKFGRYSLIISDLLEGVFNITIVISKFERFC
jgi:hypothetical protein